MKMQQVTRIVVFCALSSVTATGSYAQTSQVDSLTYANPGFLGLQPAENDNSGNCCHPRISDDGRHVLFMSTAKNLVAGDHNNNVDLFLRDRMLGTTRRMNVRSDGTQGRSGDAASAVAGAISANGDLVVFSSRQFDLVSGDTNLASDVFLHQVSTGTTTRIVTGVGGAEPDDAVSNPSLSGDGRFVVFESSATNLAANHSPGQHVYLLDRNSGALERISVTPGGNASSGSSGNATVSDDGRFVAFESAADDLVVTPGNGNTQLFVRDRQIGITLRLSQNGTTLANLPVLNSVIAGNGSRVVFETSATNLDANDSNGVEDIYAVSVGSGALTRISLGDSGQQTFERSQRPAVSRDGQRVAFQSRGVLASGGSSAFEQVYLRDLGLQSVQLVSVNNGGNNGDQDEVDASLSGNGQVVTFNAASSDLVSGDSNGLRDRFVRDLSAGSTERISLADSSGPFPSQANGDSTSSARGQRQLSADGRFLVTATVAKNLGSLGMTGTSGQIVRIDAQGNLARLISSDVNGNQAISGATDPAMSSDGRFIVFRSATTNLVAGDSNNAPDIFWIDTTGGSVERVNLGSGGVQGLGGATTSLPTVSDDGNAIAFSSNQNNLVAGDSNSALDIFVRDRGAASTARVSVDSFGAQANGLSDFPVISADGRFVVFTSLASNLVSGDSGGFQDIFRHDRQSGETVLISQSSAGAQGNGNSFVSAISADGSVVTFSSAASNLVSGDNNARTDIFVRDLNLGTTTLVSRSSAGVLSGGTSSVPSISADGRKVGFLSAGNNLVVGDSNNLEDLFRHDRQSGQTLLVSVDPEGRQVRGNQATVTAGQLSPDGSVVLIETNAQDWQLGIGVSGRRGLLLATPMLAPPSVDIFANGFEPSQP